MKSVLDCLNREPLAILFCNLQLQLGFVEHQLEVAFGTGPVQMSQTWHARSIYQLAIVAGSMLTSTADQVPSRHPGYQDFRVLISKKKKKNPARVNFLEVFEKKKKPFLLLCHHICVPFFLPLIPLFLHFHLSFILSFPLEILLCFLCIFFQTESTHLYFLRHLECCALMCGWVIVCPSGCPCWNESSEVKARF